MSITLHAADKQIIPVKFWGFPGGELRTVFLNGEIMNEEAFSVLRERLKQEG